MLAGVKQRLRNYERCLQALEVECFKLRDWRGKALPPQRTTVDRQLALNREIIRTMERGMASTWRLFELEATGQNRAGTKHPAG